MQGRIGRNVVARGDERADLASLLCLRGTRRAYAEMGTYLIGACLIQFTVQIRVDML
jgi:hypothetical protein